MGVKKQSQGRCFNQYVAVCKGPVLFDPEERSDLCCGRNRPAAKGGIVTV